MKTIQIAMDGPLDSFSWHQPEQQLRIHEEILERGRRFHRHRRPRGCCIHVH